MTHPLKPSAMQTLMCLRSLPHRWTYPPRPYCATSPLSVQHITKLYIPEGRVTYISSLDFEPLEGRTSVLVVYELPMPSTIPGTQ